MQAVTFLGKHQFLIPANLILMALFFFSVNGHWYAFDILVVSLSSLLLMFALKQLFHRRRPQQPLLFEAKGLSFPSGHAIMSVCFYGLLLHILMHSSLPTAFTIPVLIAGIILVLLIGFSRIYLQVHYLSDVLAGLIIGCCWLYIALHIFKQLDFLLVT
jgi:undecaprenyl-diphosphatase